MRYRKLLAILLPFALFAGPEVSWAKHSGQSNPKQSHSKSQAGKTEHVQGYTTKKGKKVKAYNRHPAGTAPNNKR
jgi:hypothetical protein